MSNVPNITSPYMIVRGTMAHLRVAERIEVHLCSGQTLYGTTGETEHDDVLVLEEAGTSGFRRTSIHAASIIAIGVWHSTAQATDEPTARTKLATVERREPQRASDTAIQAAKDAGYSVHQGGAEDEHLAGLWWWSLTKPGWQDVQTGPLAHKTEAGAWFAAVEHHQENA